VATRDGAAGAEAEAESFGAEREESSFDPDPEDAPAEQSTLEAIIGERVRQYRQAASLSSTDLAHRTGMSRAMISRVESATTSSSLSTLQRLAEGLGIPVTALFRGVDSEREAVYTPAGAGALTVRSGTRHGHEYRSLGHLRATGEAALEPTLVTLTEASMVFPLFQHPGEEFLYMLEGKLEYRHGQLTYMLEPGDSLTFRGETPHGPERLVDVPIRFLAIINYGSPGGTGEAEPLTGFGRYTAPDSAH